MNTSSDKKSRERKPRGYWTKEMVRLEALKYTTRKKFQIGTPSAYKLCLQNNWFSEMCSHMVR